MNSNNIPKHLKRYIVEQNYDRYSIIDHNVWSFIMEISIPFFKKHAHHTYFKGLKKTGITFDKIPSIERMNYKMNKFGWGAVAVRGFIPPAIFMEFQALGILPIACDMRSSEHLTYTPAPDIVHESAGHSPIIINEEYAHYLKEYGTIASRATFSDTDKDIYYAIRHLSDIKEDRNATSNQILEAEQALIDIKNSQSVPSEATLLSRLHWWTVEYGLIGSLDNPKIYGAGLLSSVGESQNCLDNNVKKIPLSIDCINYNYDITEQQPQLFVTKSFSELTDVLYEFEKTMSYYSNKSKINNLFNKDYNQDKIFELTQPNHLNQQDSKLIKLYNDFHTNGCSLEDTIKCLDEYYPNEWLLRFNIYKKNYHRDDNWVKKLRSFLSNFQIDSDLNNAINRGLKILEETIN